MERWAEHFAELLKAGALIEEEVEENENIEIRSVEDEVIPPPTLLEADIR
jgi:hypothetical protein